MCIFDEEGQEPSPKRAISHSFAEYVNKGGKRTM